MIATTTEATKKDKHLSALSSLCSTNKGWAEVDRRCKGSSGSVMDVWCGDNCRIKNIRVRLSKPEVLLWFYCQSGNNTFVATRVSLPQHFFFSHFLDKNVRS